MKKELRYRYKIKRKYFQHSAREVADGAIADEVLLAFDDSESFFVYYSFGAEADTHLIISRLLGAGKKVYLPRVCGENICAVAFYGDEGALVQNKFGIGEPAGESFEGKIDVCITPLLAVDRLGFRLGYGGGYYDRFFAAHPDILRVGIGYNLQIYDGDFGEAGDVPLDIYVSERGLNYFGRNDRTQK